MTKIVHRFGRRSQSKYDLKGKFSQALITTIRAISQDASKFSRKFK